MSKTNIGVIIGHRKVFPGGIAEAGRRQMLEILRRHDVNPIVLDEGQTPNGAVSSYEDSKKYAALFSERREELDGIIVSLPDFGDESSVAATLKLARLDIPVWVQAFPDSRSRFTVEHRRDAFCGKLSVCNNLRQSGIKYSLGDMHVIDPESPAFGEELAWFSGVCRVVKGLRRARIGQIGARTPDFQTVRFSEKLLERSGITTVTVDLSDIMAEAERLKDDDKAVAERKQQLTDYIFAKSGVPQEKVLTIAKLSMAVENWVIARDLDSYSIQCWPSMQKELGVYPCIFMSFMSNNMLPSACETDVLGALSMYALQLASETPSGLFDLNNNFGDDPDRMVVFHCGNCPVDLLKNASAQYNAMAERRGGLENSFSTIYGTVKQGPFTFARVSTDDLDGRIKSYIGEGDMRDENLETFGNVGVMEVKRLQKLLKYLCREGFEHHVALNGGRSASILHEAFENYLGWDVYHHGEE